MNQKLVFLYLIWVVICFYTVFYNRAHIDESKYLIKGSLILSGQISYYQTKDFFYQHMPGSLLLFGLGQQIFGRSLLIARIQSLLFALIIPYFTYKLSKLFTKKRGAGIFSLLLLISAPILAFDYTSATPLSIIALLFVLGFYFLFLEKIYMATVVFTLIFITRENFVFNLILYYLFLLYQYRNKLSIFLINISQFLFLDVYIALPSKFCIFYYYI